MKRRIVKVQRLVPIEAPGGLSRTRACLGQGLEFKPG